MGSCYDCERKKDETELSLQALETPGSNQVRRNITKDDFRNSLLLEYSQNQYSLKSESNVKNILSEEHEEALPIYIEAGV